MTIYCIGLGLGTFSHIVRSTCRHANPRYHLRAQADVEQERVPISQFMFPDTISYKSEPLDGPSILPSPGMANGLDP
jgi:hypothetical protein